MKFKEINIPKENPKVGDMIIENYYYYLICERENDGYYLLNLNNGKLINSKVYDSIRELLQGEGLINYTSIHNSKIEVSYKV